MSKHMLDFRSVSRSLCLLTSILVLLLSISSTYGSAYSYLSLEPKVTVTSPPVFLQAGTAGSSVIYAYNTSARVSTAAPSVAFDAVGSGNNGGGSASVSWSHTTGSGPNRIMIVGVSIRITTVSVSSITYGAQSLTFIRADTHASATIRSELWYLIAPASGTATVTMTLSGTSMATGGSCTYTGVAQTSPLDVNGGGTGKSASPSQSVTVSTQSSWLLGHLAISSSSKTVSEGSSQTMRWDQVTTGGNPQDRNRGHGSDKGPVGTGSQTMSWTLSGSEDWAVSVVAFKPAGSSNYNYVLKIVNKVSDSWKIRLKAYSNSSLSRLNNCTIYFRSSADGTSRQIYIQNGAYVNQTGPWYDLPGPINTERYIVVSLQANNSQVSYVYVYLEILIPNKTTYAQYVITFEIT